MSRATIRKADLDRVLKALRDDGQAIGRVEVEPGGKVTIWVGAAAASLTPLERARAERDAREARDARRTPRDKGD